MTTQFNTVKLESMRRKKKLGVGQHHGDLRRALLKATVEILEAGTERPSLREVARAAGVSQAAPYHHFGSRSGLMAAVATEGFVSLEEDLLEVIRRTNNAVRRVGKLTATYVEFALTHPQHYRLMFDPELEPDDEELELIARRVFGHLVGALADALPDAETKTVQARARQIFALAHGSIALAGSEALAKLGGPDTPEGIAREVASAATALLAV
ncbi:MAG: TetR/AcrR family transcriptional regulator [Myxococcota bacterium]